MSLSNRCSRLLSLCLAVAFVTACSQEPEPVADTAPATAPIGEPPQVQLPEGIAPTHYSIALTIDPAQETFSGQTTIDVELAAPLAHFWMHGNALQVESAVATLEDGREISLDWQQVTDFGVASVTPAETLSAGTATLRIDYTAPFNTSLEGLYKVIDDGEPYAFTQFESTSARLAFPSFDEPRFKVPFDVTLTVPADVVAITNAPAVSEKPVGDMREITYATTPPLPTYLIAFAVGDFDVVEGETIPVSDVRDRPIPVRGVATRGKGEDLAFALANTTDIVLAFEEYFDAPYPYRKLDLIAVPDFAAGAMENAGAITYREQLLLIDEESPIGQRRGFFITHAHELAHQWFGNLVTPVWWTDIWLNEAFATWHAYTILDGLYPDENYDDSLRNYIAYVMPLDSLASARQIREPIRRHPDIGSSFNSITYVKGGGVLAMFESFLGPENFRQGLREYMDTYAFANTTAEDFIGAIADANPQVDGEDLRTAFASFIGQPGIPTLNMSINCSDNDVALSVEQKRYLPVGSEGDSDQSWTIPACVSLLQENGETAQQCFLLDQEQAEVPLSVERCPAAILPNAGGASYYRWSLPAEGWASLMARFDSLTTPEQLSVTSSLSAALNDGSLDLATYLDAVPTVAAADSYRVALAPRGDLYKVLTDLLDEEAASQLKARLREIYRPRFDALDGMGQRSLEDQQLWSSLYAMLALRLDDEELHARLARAGRDMLSIPEGEVVSSLGIIDSEVRDVALVAAVEAGGAAVAREMWQRGMTTEDALLRQEMIGAAARVKDLSALREMLDHALEPSTRDNEVTWIIGNALARPDTSEVAWAWSKDNLMAIIDRLPTWNKGKLPEEYEGFCSREKAEALQALFDPIIEDLESGPRYLANAVETINLCAAFVEHHRAAMQG